MRVFLVAALMFGVACEEDGMRMMGSPDMLPFTPSAPIESALMYREVQGLDPVSLPPVDPVNGGEPPVTTISAWDVDGDGRVEIIAEASSFQNGRYTRSFRIFRYRQGALERMAEWPEDKRVVAMPDLDGDGSPELFTSFTTAIAWGERSNGVLSHREKPLPQGGYIGSYCNMVDLDRDGLVDIMCTQACDKPTAFQALLQRPGREFEVRNIGGPPVVETYAFLAASLVSGTGLLLGAIGQNCQHDPKRVVPILFRHEGQENTMRVAEGGELPILSAAPMGGTVADFDEDGSDEVVITTHPDVVMVSKGREIFGSFRFAHSDRGKLMIGWPTAAIDMDLDGQTDLLVAYGADDKYSQEVKEIGPMHTVGFRNLGDPKLEVFGRFESLGDMDKRGDWRTISVMDLDEDGDPDIGIGGYGDQPHVYLNEAKGNGASMRFIDARGQTPYGSLVKMHTAAGTRLRRVGSNIGSPFVISEPLLFIGLGSETACTVEVTWPSGKTTKHTVQARAQTLVREPKEK